LGGKKKHMQEFVGFLRERNKLIMVSVFDVGKMFLIALK
jgi:hypothetical protein